MTDHSLQSRAGKRSAINAFEEVAREGYESAIVEVLKEIWFYRVAGVRITEPSHKLKKEYKGRVRLSPGKRIEPADVPEQYRGFVLPDVDTGRGYLKPGQGRGTRERRKKIAGAGGGDTVT